MFPELRDGRACKKLGWKASEIGFVVPIHDRIYIHDCSLNYTWTTFRIEMLEYLPSLAPFRIYWIKWANDGIMLISTRDTHTQNKGSYVSMSVIPTLVRATVCGRLY